MVDLIKRWKILVIFLISFAFFWQVFLRGLLPIPADTIVGLYYPFRDIYAKEYPRGVPFKNFLITDPVRQTYPWKKLAIDVEKRLELPLWNPYNFSGTPLLGNLQSSPFYPLNILLFLFPFSMGWTLFIVLQPILAGVFMFLYLKNLNLKTSASLLGSIVFSFCGFSIAWMEWGNVIHTALWLPLVLLSIDKSIGIMKHEARIMVRKNLIWSLVFIFSLTSSFLAGHLQIFFYVSVLSLAYFLFRWFTNKKIFKILFVFLIFTILFLILTFIQWYPLLQFILLSARNADIVGYRNTGWFIPWQNLIQLIVPDFFGNPATLNYFGVWNYSEFIGYIGIFPLVAALYAVLFRRDKNVLFFSAIAALCLIMALPNPIAKIPFILHIPLIETSQPTRLIFLVDFCLSVLAAFGFDYYSKEKKGIIYVLSLLCLLFIGIWVFILFGSFGIMYQEDLMVSRQNLFLPTIILMIVFVLFIAFRFSKDSKQSKVDFLFVLLLIFITCLDLFRFGWKFEAFTKKEYLFPNTPVLSFLQKQKGPFRVMSKDSQILPPNFSSIYHIQTTDGYDPLYLLRYGEFAVSYARNKPDISTPFGFNRIITLQDVTMKFSDFLGIKYILSSSNLDNPGLSKVFSDGQIRVYENPRAFPRAFFVSSSVAFENKQDEMNTMHDPKVPLFEQAIVESSDKRLFNRDWVKGEVEEISYSENKILINTKSDRDGFLVLTDSYYPTWHVTIDGVENKIYLTDYAFRGVIVPAGKHSIKFFDKLF